ARPPLESPMSPAPRPLPPPPTPPHAKPPRPGHRATDHAAMVRVDQAGEYGAVRIYAGQLAVLGDRHPMSREISHMAAQEERHRAYFDAMIARRGVRPTILQPFWHVA